MVWFQVPVVLTATLSHLCVFPPNVFPNTSCCFSLFFPMVSSLKDPVGLSCKVPAGATSFSLSLTHPSTVFSCFHFFTSSSLKCLHFLCWGSSREKNQLFSMSLTLCRVLRYGHSFPGPWGILNLPGRKPSGGSLNWWLRQIPWRKPWLLWGYNLF